MSINEQIEKLGHALAAYSAPVSRPCRHDARRESEGLSGQDVQAVTDDAAGEIIAGMREDLRAGKLPGLFVNIHHMAGYLADCPESIAVLPIVWRRYKRWLDRHPQ